MAVCVDSKFGCQCQPKSQPYQTFALSVDDS